MGIIGCDCDASICGYIICESSVVLLIQYREP
jgi:hypothetical protein